MGYFSRFSLADSEAQPDFEDHQGDSENDQRGQNDHHVPG